MFYLPLEILASTFVHKLKILKRTVVFSIYFVVSDKFILPQSLQAIAAPEPSAVFSRKVVDVSTISLDEVPRCMAPPFLLMQM